MDKLISRFSSHLFWDSNRGELNIERHKKYIIRNVLLFGNLNDWELLKRIYGISSITETAASIKDIDKKTASFLSIIGNIPKNHFSCYSTKQSTAKHWSF